MFFVEIALSLAVSLLVATSASGVLHSQMSAVRSAEDLQFYAHNVASINSAFQKIVGRAVDFYVYDTDINARAGTFAGRTTSNGDATRLEYIDSSGVVNVAILYFQNGQVIYENIFPTTTSWILATKLDAARFHISDPDAPIAAGLLVMEIEKQSRSVTLYGERL